MAGSLAGRGQWPFCTMVPAALLSDQPSLVMTSLRPRQGNKLGWSGRWVGQAGSPPPPHTHPPAPMTQQALLTRACRSRSLHCPRPDCPAGPGPAIIMPGEGAVMTIEREWHWCALRSQEAHTPGRQGAGRADRALHAAPQSCAASHQERIAVRREGVVAAIRALAHGQADAPARVAAPAAGAHGARCSACLRCERWRRQWLTECRRHPENALQQPRVPRVPCGGART